MATTIAIPSVIVGPIGAAAADGVLVTGVGWAAVADPVAVFEGLTLLPWPQPARTAATNATASSR